MFVVSSKWILVKIKIYIYKNKTNKTITLTALYEKTFLSCLNFPWPFSLCNITQFNLKLTRIFKQMSSLLILLRIFVFVSIAPTYKHQHSFLPHIFCYSTWVLANSLEGESLICSLENCKFKLIVWYLTSCSYLQLFFVSITFNSLIKFCPS